MRVATAKEMKEIDRRAMDEYGIPGIVLMENAGIKVVEAIKQHFGGRVQGKTVTVFVGKGNNGGDGLVIARHLYNNGADVRLMIIDEPEKLTGDAAVNLTIWQNLKQKVYRVDQPNGINLVKVSLMTTDLIIDAMYGTGFRGQVSERVGRIIELINSSNLPVISVDIPSGLEADTGKIGGICVKATLTVTFGLPKIGMLLEQGAEVCGELVVADISLPNALLQSSSNKKMLLDTEVVRPWLPRRGAATHKGDCGRVLIVAGSRGMSGAGILAATACLRSGAGLVTLAVPEDVHSTVSGRVPEMMTLPLPANDGTLSVDALPLILEKLQKVDVLAIGPGLSQQANVQEMLRRLLPKVNKPMVIDADALNALAGSTEILRQLTAPAVLTPHPGEMSRLLGISLAEVQEQRLPLTVNSADEWGCTVLLKGARTLIAAPGGVLYINPTGNPGMATAGSGDVLTGIIAGFIAQGMQADQAAAAGAYIHGLAGDYAGKHLGYCGLTAGDIINYLPQSIMRVEK